jgi:hypothetical protein
MSDILAHERVWPPWPRNPAREPTICVQGFMEVCKIPQPSRTIRRRTAGLAGSCGQKSPRWSVRHTGCPSAGSSEAPEVAPPEDQTLRCAQCLATVAREKDRCRLPAPIGTCSPIPTDMSSRSAVSPGRTAVRALGRPRRIFPGFPAPAGKWRSAPVRPATRLALPRTGGRPLLRFDPAPPRQPVRPGLRQKYFALPRNAAASHP